MTSARTKRASNNTSGMQSRLGHSSSFSHDPGAGREHGDRSNAPGRGPRPGAMRGNNKWLWKKARKSWPENMTINFPAEIYDAAEMPDIDFNPGLFPILKFA